MVIIKLTGGLGNQMFEYAFGRALSLKHNQTLLLDISAYKRSNNNTPRKYGLDFFNIKFQTINCNFFSGFFLFIDLIVKKIFKADFIIKETPQQVFKYNHNIKIRSFIPNYYYGYWQSFKYFSEYQDVIANDFISKLKNSLEFENFKAKINNCLSISVHVRRGDYVGNHDYEVCTLDYYQKSINFFEEKFNAATFFVFSDDPSWVKNNLKFKNNYVIVSGTGYNENEELLLMSFCQHNIISNSSFSWWAAWLNKNTQKFVVTPSKWMNVDGWEKVPDLIPDNWVKIN